MDGQVEITSAALLSPGFIWTDEKIERLKMMLAEGRSRAQIGAELGCSRNAVTGKTNRLGLCGTRPVAKPKRKRTNALLVAVDESQERATAAHTGSASRPGANLERIKSVLRGTGAPLPSPSDLATKAFGTPCTLVELGPGSCHWPINDGGPFMFCNAPAVEEFPYCAQHCGLSYYKPARAA